MAIGVTHILYFVFYLFLLKNNISKTILASSVKSKVLKHNLLGHFYLWTYAKFSALFRSTAS